MLIGYSQDFVDPDKCKEVAENQIAQGADVVFQVAGGCGLGALEAAEERVSGVSASTPTRVHGPARPDERVKKVDLGVSRRIEARKAGKFNGNT